MSSANEGAAHQETARAKANPRAAWANALPGLVAALGAYLFLFPQMELPARVFYAAGAGLFLPLGGMLLGLFAEYVVRRVATGGEPHTSTITADRQVAAAVALVFVVVWLLGVHWRTRERERIAECLREVERGVLSQQARGEGNSVSWYCTEYYGLQNHGTDHDD